MYYNFLFNGCSITYGDELHHNGRGIEHLKSHRYSAVISNHFNKTHDNIAVGGSSNDTIVKRTIDWFEEGNTCDFAVIQFTFKERAVDWYDGAKAYPMGPNFKMDRVKGYKAAQMLYYKTFYTDYLGNQNLYKNIFFLKKYFELKNIKHYFFGAYRGKLHHAGWELHCDSLPCILSEIEEFKWGYNETYHHIGGHPNALGHQAIANYLIPNIEL